jgi:histidinol-phosphate aminotransferase
MLSNRAKILATRGRLAGQLPPLGFTAYDSDANFIWTQHESGQHQAIYEQLKKRRVLVRYIQFPGAGHDGSILDGLRITVGTDAEIDRLLDVLKECVNNL